MSSEPFDDQQLSKRAVADLISAMAGGMEDSCFTRCLSKPGLRMDAKQERCVKMCMERFVEAWTITSGTIANVSAKAHNANGGDES